MKIYPTNQVLIMNDALFAEYGGETGTSTVNQRRVAYRIAEKQAAGNIGTVLLEMDITGSYRPTANGRVALDYGYVNRIHWMTMRYDTGPGSQPVMYYLSGTGYYNLFDDRRGYVDLSPSLECYGRYPSQVEIVYHAGIPTGMIQEDHVLGLTILADIALKEMYDPTGNESAGDIGVQEFSSDGYSEKRVPLGRTDLGSSARVRKAWLMFSDLRIMRYGDAG